MKKIIFLLIATMILSIGMTVGAYDGFKLVAEYDMTDNLNKVNKEVYPLSTSLRFLPITELEYEQKYRIAGVWKDNFDKGILNEDLTKNGSPYAKGTISEIKNELTGDFVFDAWAYSIGDGWQVLFSIGDSDKKLNYRVFRVCNGYLQFEDLYAKDEQNIRVIYKNTDIKTIAKGWNHFVVVYTKGAESQTVYIDGKEYVLLRSTTDIPTGATVKDFTDDVNFIYNCSADSSNSSRFRFSDMKIYKGSTTKENLEEMAKTGAEKYEAGFNVALYQDEVLVKKDKLSYMTEAKTVVAKIKEVVSADVTTENVYLEDINTKNKVTGKISVKSETEVEIEFFVPVGTYKLVIEADVSNKRGQRKTDYVLEFKINEDLAFKSLVRQDLKSESSLLEGVLRKYESYLGIDFLVYESCVGKSAVLDKLAKYIEENEDFEFSNIAPKFKELCDEQVVLDYKDGIEALNQEFKKTELEILKIENIIFNTYGACFSVSDELKTAYAGISDKAKVFEALKGKTYSTDNVNETIQTIKKDIDNSIFAIKRAEMYVSLDNASEADFEGILKEIVTKYGLDFDLENKDYKAQKQNIIAELSKSDINEENFIKKANRAILAENLNAVEIGDRARVEYLINTYGKFVTLPKAYTDATDKTDYHKKMIGKSYTEKTLETVIDEAVEEADFVYEEQNGSGSRPSGGRGGSGAISMLPSVSVEIPNVEPTEEIRAANEKKAVFLDLTDYAWATEAIEGLYEKGIVNGVGEGMFCPQKEIVREEAVKIIVEAFNLKGNGEAISFNDVKPEFWAAPYISTSIENGIIMGMSDTEFGTGEKIKREDFAVMIYRIIQKFELTLKEGESKEFNDKESISDYAVPAIEKLSALGVMNGDEAGNCKPKSLLTRAEGAKMIYNILEMMEVEA